MIKNQRYINYFFFALVILSFCLETLAEYRIYQYWVKSPDREKAELITSSLDPRAYIAYYGKGPGSTISLMRSWICYGDTGGHLPPCTFEFIESKPVNDVNPLPTTP